MNTLIQMMREAHRLLPDCADPDETWAMLDVMGKLDLFLTLWDGTGDAETRGFAKENPDIVALVNKLKGVV